MNRASSASAIAGFSAKDLSHHLFQLSALCDTVPVAPVGADNVIVFAKSGTDTSRNRLLAKIGMEVADNQPLPIKLYTLGLEIPNGVNRTIKLFKKLLRIHHCLSLSISNLWRRQTTVLQIRKSDTYLLYKTNLPSRESFLYRRMLRPQP